MPSRTLAIRSNVRVKRASARAPTGQHAPAVQGSDESLKLHGARVNVTERQHPLAYVLVRRPRPVNVTFEGQSVL